MAIYRQQQSRLLKTPLILTSLLHLAAVVVAAAAVAVQDVRLSAKCSRYRYFSSVQQLLKSCSVHHCSSSSSIFIPTEAILTPNGIRLFGVILPVVVYIDYCGQVPNHVFGEIGFVSWRYSSI